MFMGRIHHQADLIGALTEAARANGIQAGAIQVTGALRRAKLGFYDQWIKAYRELPFNKPLEIVSGTGNISLRDGTPFVHLHLALSDEEGKVFGGHAMEGCTVFAAEYVIMPLPGAAPVRVFDETTGLFLWEREQYPAPGQKELPPELERALFHP
uniref:DNA-binding protein n=1 Tax=Geobacter metallireducens TaxID=28232 RepID=A0A831UCE7_GEOME